MDESSDQTISPEDQSNIVQKMLRFPAFADAKKMNAEGGRLFSLIVEAYGNEQLTEEQDLIFEAILYLSGLSDDFDLRRALSVWPEGDFLQFQSLLAEFKS